jgi:hypothetical protein
VAESEGLEDVIRFDAIKWPITISGSMENHASGDAFWCFVKYSMA